MNNIYTILSRPEVLVSYSSDEDQIKSTQYRTVLSRLVILILSLSVSLLEFLWNLISLLAKTKNDIIDTKQNFNGHFQL